ncbi:GDP-L-fucose synthase [Pseudomonadales bacterium]|nr:GDP-L-fucose synthase [Pseudomonadales bacterium]
MTKIFVAGHNGMVGSAICRQLQDEDVDLITASRQELDLTNQAQVDEFFSTHRFNQVYLAAAKVGGIHANNTYPAEFIYENLMIQSNVIHTAYRCGVQKLLFLGSSCIYPKMAEQPMKESDLLTGKLEPTNEPYALAKISGIKMCESYRRQYEVDFRSVMPTNLYGPGDNFNLKNSHVVPSLLRKFHEAKVNKEPFVQVWGSGDALREFLYVDDMAAACKFFMELPNSQFGACCSKNNEHVNIGFGEDLSIRELALKVKETTGYSGAIEFDVSKADGAPRKLLSSDVANSLGWQPAISLDEGLVITYEWFKENFSSIRDN